MTLVLNLSPTVQARISSEAEQRGITEEEVALEALEDRFRPAPGSLTPRELIEYWDREGIIGAWGDESLDAPELARELRQRAEMRGGAEE